MLCLIVLVFVCVWNVLLRVSFFVCYVVSSLVRVHKSNVLGLGLGLEKLKFCTNCIVNVGGKRCCGCLLAKLSERDNIANTYLHATVILAQNRKILLQILK